MPTGHPSTPRHAGRKKGREEVSVGEEELIPEDEAARYLDISMARLRELVVQGELRMVLVKGPNGEEAMYLRSQVLRLKEILTADEKESEVEEWPDIIGG